MLHEIPSPLPLVRVSLLGPLEVCRRETSGTWKTITKEQWGKRRTDRSVFKRLCSTPGRRLSRGRLLDDIWPDTSFELADKYLYTAISVLHGILGKDLVKTREATYELAGQALIWLDIDACESLLKRAENQGYTSLSSLPLLEETQGYLERGEYLEGESGTWAYGLRKKSEDMLRQCRLWLAESYERQGKLWQAGEQYRTMFQAEPSDEEALRRWMLLLAHQGKPQAALKCYQDMKGLAEEQDLTLSPALDLLVQQIKAQPVPVPRLLSAPPETQEEIRRTPVFPEKAAPLWLLPTIHQDTPFHPAIWSFFLHEETQDVATHLTLLYDDLETEILAMALEWQRSSPIAPLQQSVYETLRKYDAMPKDQPDVETRITRRHALQSIAQFPIQLYGLAFLLSEQYTLPSPEEFLPLCAVGLSACLELRDYQPEGWVIIRRILAAYLPTLERLAQQSSPMKQTAAHLAAQGYLLAGLQAEYMGKLDLMAATAHRARFYGQLANDPNLEIEAVRRLAVKFDFERREIKSLETYREALALPGFAQVSPSLQGMVYFGLAATHAYCQKAPEALSFLSQAKEVFPKDPPPAHPDAVFAYAGKYDFVLYEGLTLKHTTYYNAAADAFKRYGSFEPQPDLRETNRAEFLNYTATVAVRQHDLEAASAYLDAAEEVAAITQHKLRQNEVRETLRDMQLIWPDEPKVKTLQAKMYARQH